MPLTFPELNNLDQTAFTAALGHIFEHSPWVAQRTHRERPFQDFVTLHTLLCTTMRSAARAEQLALIRAHPDLGGRLEQLKQLTVESASEQASAGLDAMDDKEFAEFQKLNTDYRARFGFPFIICARLNDRDSIMEAMRWRVMNTRAEELENALGEIEKIAWLRLQDAIKS
ncbi:MAG TPA: 2-oxo-4-hydroxy-4-carboxy-5-ureidoimidazoline decarboxylase [Opitutaceae bacterium]|nr:2-oxo-4-hydroxy-4-carboxy-5-ureidoimidazoline decarboxylase [Opitutaceae bacterium]